MAQTGYTPLLIYASGTATNVPLAANLTSNSSGAELAINYADGKLFYKDSSGVVQVLASKTAASTTFSAGTTGFTPSTATAGAVTLAGVLNVANGGTGLSSTPANGALDIGNGTGFTRTTLTGTASQVTVTNGSGSITLSLPSTINVNTSGSAASLSATLAIASGGTGQTTASAAFNALSPITTNGDLIVGNGTNSATRLAIGTSGYVLTSNGTVASWAASTGGVTSFSAGTTGLTPATGTTGAITLAGTLGIANGGTNSTATPTAGGVGYGTGTAHAYSAAGTSGQVLTSNGTSAPTWTTVSSGAALSNDTSTASNLYPLFANATTGTPTTIYTSNAKYLYKPSTGDLQASQVVATNGLVLNSSTISASYTIPSGQNAHSVGPITIASGQSVQVTSGQRWVVL